MSDNPNVRLVQDGYADFLRGDVPAVIAKFADEFEFTTPGAPAVPYAGTHRTRDELAGFFRKLDETVAISVFEPRQYFADGDQVVTLGHYEGHVKRSGKTFSTDWAMIWTVRDGKVHGMREISDPTQLAAGFSG